MEKIKKIKIKNHVINMQTTKINPKFPIFFWRARVVYVVPTKTLMQTKLIKKHKEKTIT